MPRICVLPSFAFLTVLLTLGCWETLPTGFAADSQNVEVGDAYARRSSDGQQWTIGAKTIQMTFDCRDGMFRLVSFLNRASDPAQEYVDAKTAACPFALDSEAFAKNTTDPNLAAAESRWTLKGSEAKRVLTGGRPAVQVDFTLARGDLVAHYHVLAFPGVPILRQWVELENAGSQPVTVALPASISLRLRGDEATSYLHSSIVGGHAAPDQGNLMQGPIASPSHGRLTSGGSSDLVPWMALHRNQGPQDGWFMALEYLGVWSMTVDYEAGGPLTATAGIPEYKAKAVQPGERLEMPMVTLGVFHHGLDDMAANLYDWQYEYLWDYTNTDYYARIRSATVWFYCSRNLQEQFAARLANLDMVADQFRAIGYEMLWDDAGWSSHPGPGLPPDNYGSVFAQTYEGPDFAESQRYFRKMGMRWLLWFAGRPSAGLLDGKIGAWGDFEWRTDGVSFPTRVSDKTFHEDVKRFLDVHPRSSFHTCSGGSTYAHTFEIGGRYAAFNYLSDLGRGPYISHYFSYLEPPDKWSDLLISIASIYGRKDGSFATMAEVMAARGGEPPKAEDLRYVKESAKATLAGVPGPYGSFRDSGDIEQCRRDMELYRFFRSEGLAGRWSYAFHPSVEGDPEYYYLQRTSYDRRKACIILNHQAEKPIVIRPQRLLPDAKYTVGFESTQAVAERTGADLMANGIAIAKQEPGELVYLNLPNRPRSGTDKVAPQAPGRVLSCLETNIGHSGRALYWSPGNDDRWISYYEIRRDGQVIDKVSIGHYYFDHAAGWDGAHEYAVRTVDGDGNVSDWTAATPTKGEPMTFAALGGHFAQAGRDGWSAESMDLTGKSDGQAATNRVPRLPRSSAGHYAPSNEFFGQVELCSLAGTACQPIAAHSLFSFADTSWQQTVTQDRQAVAHDGQAVALAGEKVQCVFTPMTWIPPVKNTAADFGGTPNQRGGVEGYWESKAGARVGRGWQQASPNEACVRTWTAARPGAVHITGRAMKEYYHRDQGGPLRVKILHGEKQVWPEKDWAVAPVGDLTGVGHNIRLQVAAGDAIRFVLDNGASAENDLLAWMPRIVYEEPQSATEAPAVVRILCGAKSPYIDRCGNSWSADAYFTGGEPIATQERIDEATPTLDDQPLYQAGRTGKAFTYSIPAPPGRYAVRLKFAEPNHAAMFERPMQLDINGSRVLTDFDVVHAAQDARKAVDRAFRNIVPNAEGRIVLHFTGGWNPRVPCGEAMVQAIEVLPERRRPIRIDAGNEAAFADWNGVIWDADTGFDGGTILTSPSPVAQASPTLLDQQLYRTARSGKTLQYSFAISPGLYTVHLKFAELWLPDKVGQRPMDIEINGRVVWKAWDPSAAAGQAGMAADLRVEEITPDSTGHITIGLRAAGSHDAILQAIEIE